ncbi:FAD-dependent oxidoreductase [Angustibacter sp. McL0619]|uniref:FAD-dependent oxidoreductase n=1 Tax=Angustibacter sp. McL0619 TaxID=3415676 RepID=UPI003CEEBB60
MPPGSVAVLGAGVAGLAAALLLARDGHRVTLVERDELTADAPTDASDWPRKGVPHFHQPHAFIPRGRLELMQHLPDVYATLIAAGAHDVDGRAKLPGEVRPQDAELQYLAVRRPLLEWALRRAVLTQDRIDVRSGVRATGLRTAAGRVAAVHLDGSELAADVVVDALGRRTPTASWGARPGSEASADGVESSDCGVVYYSRYYRVRPGCELPDGPWVLGPRGDLGYLAFATFPGDNQTFAVTLAVPTGAPEWRVLNDPAAYETAVGAIGSLRLWVDPEAVDPITPVLPLAGLRNTIRRYEPTATIGLVPVGDAYCHTDPVLALGLSFSLLHAVALAQALRDHDDLADAGSAYAAATEPATRERYDLATAVDDQRYRLWTGEPVAFTRHDGAYELFSVVAAGAVAMLDPEVFRVFQRRTGLLDSTSVLDGDLDLQLRIEQQFQQLLATPRPAAGPTRADLLAATALAAAQV